MSSFVEMLAFISEFQDHDVEDLQLVFIKDSLYRMTTFIQWILVSKIFIKLSDGQIKSQLLWAMRIFFFSNLIIFLCCLILELDCCEELNQTWRRYPWQTDTQQFLVPPTPGILSLIIDSCTKPIQGWCLHWMLILVKVGFLKCCYTWLWSVAFGEKFIQNIWLKNPNKMKLPLYSKILKNHFLLKNVFDIVMLEGVTQVECCIKIDAVKPSVTHACIQNFISITTTPSTTTIWISLAQSMRDVLKAVCWWHWYNETQLYFWIVWCEFGSWTSSWHMIIQSQIILTEL